MHWQPGEGRLFASVAHSTDARWTLPDEKARAEEVEVGLQFPLPSGKGGRRAGDERSMDCDGWGDKTDGFRYDE